ncbi:MAG TPA: cytochrome P450 [Acidimicrobiales bacterium]
MTHRPVTDFATDFDHTDPAWVADPYPIYEDLRGRCPVAHSDRYGGTWLPVEHRDVAAIANDQEHFTSRSVVVVEGRPTDEAPPAPIGLAPPITSDPPFHQIARRLLLPAFSPRAVGELEGFTRDLCEGLLDSIGDVDHLDASLDYAQHIPVGVIAKMLGFPPGDGEIFRGFVHQILESVDDPFEERVARFAPLEDYFVAQVEDHRANPRDDLTSYLLDVEINGSHLEDRHIFGTMILILAAGIDTTWSAIGASIWHLAQHDDDRRRLAKDPSLLPVAIEEFLRAYAPVTMARLVKEDFSFEGCPMKKDDWVLLSFPAANRDPSFFERADEVVIDREVNRHAAFGLGIHRCIGSNLARMELRVALECFLARFGEFSLADPAAVTWSRGQVRGPRTLPLTVAAS